MTTAKNPEEKLSVRLTNDIKEGVIKNILAHSLGKEAEKLEQRRKELSDEVYNDYYDKTTRDKINALPDGWLPKRDRMHVVFGNSSTGYCERNFKEPKRFLARDMEHRALKVYPYEHRLTAKHDKLTDDIKEHNEKMKKAEISARGVINNCNTTKQLKEVWPSIAKFVESYEPSQKKTGTEIAPVLTDLNKMLGLK